MRQANAIVAGRASFFGGRSGPITLTVGERLYHWTAYESDPSLLTSLGIPHSDPKFLWEPARFGWAFLLGRAYHLTQNEDYVRAFWRLFERFDRNNPPYVGPHWMNGQEVALRLLALLWSASVFVAARASTPRRLETLARAVAHHAARIPPTLIYARSQNNNHLITESTALYLAGAALDHRPWIEVGWRTLNRALQRQIDSSGEYVQHSTNYHRLMLQSVLMADAVRRGRGEQWSSAAQHAVARAVHWLFAMLDPKSGSVPNLGANDGALILPLSVAPFDDYRPTVQAAARAFLRTALPSGEWDDLSWWLGLQETRHPVVPAAYAGEHIRGRESWAYLRASTSPSRLGHMDQLHLDLWWRGFNIAADPGTYLYNAAPPWDNPLVSSRVHNCVVVDGHEQMTRVGRFMVLDWVPASARQVLSPEMPALSQMIASHRAYDRRGVRYQRIVTAMEGDAWRIKDDLAFKPGRRHEVRLHWLLLDGDWHLQQRGSEVLLRFRVPAGWIVLRVALSDASIGQLRTVIIRAGRLVHGKAEVRPYEGWRSPIYGRKVPALSFAVNVTASRSFSMVTEFRPPA